MKPFKIELTETDIIKIKKRKVSPGSIYNARRTVENYKKINRSARAKWGIPELTYLKNLKFLELARESHPEYFL